MEGDEKTGCFLAGQIAAIVNKEQPAAEIIREIFEEAETVLNGGEKMGKIAMVFAGQGAQYPGMGKILVRGKRRRPGRCSTWRSGMRPGTLAQCFEGTKEELTVTRNTQPCLYCVDLAAACALREAGMAPDGPGGLLPGGDSGR